MRTISCARFIAGIALLTGTAGDLLLRAVPWGVNFTLWALLLLGSVILVALRTRSPLPRGAVAILAASVGCAAFLSLRDSPALGFWNVVATLAGVGLVAVRVPSGSLSSSPLWQYLHASVLHAGHTIGGAAFLLLKDLRPQPEEKSRGGFRWTPVLRGAALTLPAFMLFGGLLVSADATFEYVAREILQLDFWTIVSHLFLIGLFTWTVAGFLRGRYLAGDRTLGADPGLPGLKVGIVELGILLGALDLLFFIFMCVQIPYFFGGQATLLGTSSLTCADYARRGFFELLAVSALALPMLFWAEWALRKVGKWDLILLRVLALVMCLLLLGMLTSAAQRLWIYAETFGLTGQRVYAAAFLAWLAIVIIWFALTVLRGVRQRFPFGAVCSAYAVLLLLDLLNPDALIASVNIRHAAASCTFDATHAASLSADALPALLDGLPQIPQAERGSLARGILCRFKAREVRTDWRSWNAAYSSARRMVLDQQRALEAYSKAGGDPASQREPHQDP